MESLGAVERVTIGGRNATLRFPVADEKDHVSAPMDSRGNSLSPLLTRAIGNDWGYKSTSRLYFVNGAAISAPFSSKEDLHEDVADFGESYMLWFRIVQEWAAAWTGRPLKDSERTHESAIMVKRGKHTLGSGMLVGSIHFGVIGLNPDQLHAALGHASRDEHLPVQHQMLLYAQDAQIVGDFRRAVIDAATAVEVALGSFITERMTDAGVPENFSSELLKSANGLVGLYSLCKQLGKDPGVSKTKANEELAKIRNEAAHAGKTPTPEQATRARQHAATIVRTVTPLPDL